MVYRRPRRKALIAHGCRVIPGSRSLSAQTPELTHDGDKPAAGRRAQEQEERQQDVSPCMAQSQGTCSHREGLSGGLRRSQILPSQMYTLQVTFGGYEAT